MTETPLAATPLADAAAPGAAAPETEAPETETPDAARPVGPGHILIKAKGGLGNRILSAIGGLVYADLSGRRPAIDWRDGAYAPKGVNSHPLLFDAPPAPDPASLEAIEDVRPAIWRGRLDRHPMGLIFELHPNSHSNPFIYRRFCVDLDRLDRETPLVVYWSYLPKLARMRRLMDRDPRFRGKSLPDVFRLYLDRWFTPNARVRAAAEALAPGGGPPVIGVHIRHTDRTTPLPAFRKALSAALAAAPEASVFLATDSAAVEADFRARFPRVFTAEKWFPPGGARLHGNRDAPDMVREAENALIDMWTLSRCDRLIYSRNSTFSYTSLLLSGRDEADAVDVERGNLLLRAKRFVQDYA